MSSESENNVIPQKYISDKDKAIFMAGYLGFGIDYLVKCLELNRKEITEQFINESGYEYDVWIHGYYLALTQLRKTILDSALNSSTPNIEKILQYFAETDEEIKKLEI